MLMDHECLIGAAQQHGGCYASAERLYQIWILTCNFMYLIAMYLTCVDTPSLVVRMDIVTDSLVQRHAS